MTELEWRRRWKPALKALPWKPLRIHGELYLIKHSVQGGSYEFMIARTAQESASNGVWYESLDEDILSKRSKKLNPSVEAPVSKIADHIQENLEDTPKSTTFSVSFKQTDDGETEKVLLTMNTKLAGLPFTWKFNGHPAKTDMIADQLTIPLLGMVGELSRRQDELHKLLHAKDKQIDDYKNQGLKVSRKHLETPVFDVTVFKNNMATSKGLEENVKKIGEAAFNCSGQELYKDVMTKYCWVYRGPAADVEGDSLEDDGSLQAPTAAPSGASWMNRLPPSLTRGSPTKSLQKNPGKSPANSDIEMSPTKNPELLRRQALQKRLVEDEAKKRNQIKKEKENEILVNYRGPSVGFISNKFS